MPTQSKTFLPRLAFAIAILAVTPILQAAHWNALGPIQDLGPGITPGIAVDSAGDIHLIYMHDGAIFYRRGSADGRFGEAEPVPVPEGTANYNSPHLVCAADGTLHLAFVRDFARESSRAWYTVRRDGRWSRPLPAIDVSGTERRANYPRIAIVDSSAYLGAFAAGGSIVARLDGIPSSPRVAARIDTPLWVAHPLIGKTGEVLVVGRHGASGHKLQRYSRDLEPIGEPLLLSRGTPTKTYEPTAVIIDDAGVVHVAGATGSGREVLWYTTFKRAAAGKPVILGPALGEDVKEYSYPVMLSDRLGRIHVSYREHTRGEGRLTVLDARAERFEPPIVVAPAVTRRLRWNPHLAAAPGGGAYIVWDSGGRVYFRAIGEAVSKLQRGAASDPS